MSDASFLINFLNIFLMVALFFFVYICSILLHELGHIFTLRKYSKKAVINFHKLEGDWQLCAGEEKDYLKLNDKQLKNVYRNGIVVGIIPLALFSLVNFWGLFLIPLYIGGCKSDLNKIKNLTK